MEGCRIAVRVQPRARADELLGERDGRLLARVRAAPADGRANEALCRLLARRAGIAPSRVSVARGAAAREKVLHVEGMQLAELRAALGLPPAGERARD
jgi:uncharacterized protein YggU (UPF0235/DUF167 family)